MPQKNRPITERDKQEDEATGNPRERHGKHRQGDEALPGKGSSKGGLNKEAGRGSQGGGREPRP